MIKEVSVILTKDVKRMYVLIKILIMPNIRISILMQGAKVLIFVKDATNMLKSPHVKLTLLMLIIDLKLLLF